MSSSGALQRRSHNYARSLGDIRSHIRGGILAIVYLTLGTAARPVEVQVTWCSSVFTAITLVTDDLFPCRKLPVGGEPVTCHRPGKRTFFDSPTNKLIIGREASMDCVDTNVSPTTLVEGITLGGTSSFSGPTLVCTATAYPFINHQIV
ncbi:hypothetical protein BKA82DRAFT_808627 [Pisolithus tinctorius]|uniref:Uncharacterized protein n=1 Tax=Pisolithus tinctorius Marx 270 TaxID=870435 RepID=A0A0C3NEX6_PISTI|nr:hypothetical protein BKA82DRAFT_808627 [Pisolithus tinctorius]KIN99624.1 hypothetical protein M404DRAFT_808627 [Pisolithus tinctorius Marx 270]